MKEETFNSYPWNVKQPLLDERFAAEHQDIVQHAHAKHSDARLLDQHGAGAEQQADQQAARRGCGGERVVRGVHAHAPKDGVRWQEKWITGDKYLQGSHNDRGQGRSSKENLVLF